MFFLCKNYTTHTHLFYGPLDFDFTEARGSGISWAICKSALCPRQPCQHPPLSFLQAGCPSCRPTNSVKALKAWLGGWKGIQPVKMSVGCWHSYLSGARCRFAYADLHMAQLMPLPLTISCNSKSNSFYLVGFTFLVLAHWGSPE